MAICLSYVGRSLWIAECTHCPWTHESRSMYESWVNWKLHDKREHA